MEQRSPPPILANNPWWRPEDGICTECARRFGDAFREAVAAALAASAARQAVRARPAASAR